jgi:hypothetical protein
MASSNDEMELSVGSAVSASATPDSERIAISKDDFKRYNAAMLRLLLCLYECGGSLSTVRLFETSGMSTAYGGKTITKTARLGYIKREKVPVPKGRFGNNPVINTITPKGKKLLKSLQLA